MVRRSDGSVADPAGTSPRGLESLGRPGSTKEAPVKFGIFYEHQLPRPWNETSEQQLIADALDQIELADRLGIQYLWEVEHHFLEEYSHSSAPEVFLAAASQRTTRMRIGHGIVQTAPAYNHPARIAERIAMLDLVSKGRVEFGTGESSSEAELGGFGVDRVTKREAWLEGLEVAIRCMTETPFGGVDGRFVTMPPRNVVPKPVQKPHPPLWVACSRRDTILLAAEKGIGALSFAFVEPEDAKQWVDDYEPVLRERCVPVGLAVNPQVACVTPMMCAQRRRTPWPGGSRGPTSSATRSPTSTSSATTFRPATNVWEEFLERRGKTGYSPEAALAAQQETLGAKAAAGDQTGLRGAVGHPGPAPRVPPALRGGRRRPADLRHAGRHNRHEHIMESIELFGTQVLPEFVERDEAARRPRRPSGSRSIEQALARRDRHDPVMPDDYVMRAIPKQMVEAPGQRTGQAVARVTGRQTGRRRRSTRSSSGWWTAESPGRSRRARGPMRRPRQELRWRRLHLPQHHWPRPGRHDRHRPSWPVEGMHCGCLCRPHRGDPGRNSGGACPPPSTSSRLGRWSTTTRRSSASTPCARPSPTPGTRRRRSAKAGPAPWSPLPRRRRLLAGQDEPTLTTAELELGGMHCSACATRIQRSLGRLPAVASASVNLATTRAFVSYDSGRTQHSRSCARPWPTSATRPRRSTTGRCRPPSTTPTTGAAGPPSRGRWPSPPWWWRLAAPETAAAGWTVLVLAIVVEIAGGWPFLRDSARLLRHGATSMDTLIALGHPGRAGGQRRRGHRPGRPAPAPRRQRRLRRPPARGDGPADRGHPGHRPGHRGQGPRPGGPGHALAALPAAADGTGGGHGRRRGGELVAPESVPVGALVRVRPGEATPARRHRGAGWSPVDESMLTGEPLPVDRGPGTRSPVAPATAAACWWSGSSAVAAESVLARLQRLVEDAQRDKAPLQRVADRISSVFVPAVLLGRRCHLPGLVAGRRQPGQGGAERRWPCCWWPVRAPWAWPRRWP